MTLDIETEVHFIAGGSYTVESVVRAKTGKNTAVRILKLSNGRFYEESFLKRLIHPLFENTTCPNCATLIAVGRKCPHCNITWNRDYLAGWRNCYEKYCCEREAV